MKEFTFTSIACSISNAAPNILTHTYTWVQLQHVNQSTHGKQLSHSVLLRTAAISSSAGDSNIL